jgi:hypothetical protein
MTAIFGGKKKSLKITFSKKHSEVNNKLFWFGLNLLNVNTFAWK